LIEERTAGEEV